MSWKQTFLNGIENGRVRELYLKKLPSLKTCDDWNKVKEIGRVSWSGKYANYNGGIVSLGENYYFVEDRRLHAVGQFRDWNFKKDLRVVDEKEWKSKVTDFHSKQRRR